MWRMAGATGLDLRSSLLSFAGMGMCDAWLARLGMALACLSTWRPDASPCYGRRRCGRARRRRARCGRRWRPCARRGRRPRWLPRGSSWSSGTCSWATAPAWRPRTAACGALMLAVRGHTDPATCRLPNIPSEQRMLPMQGPRLCRLHCFLCCMACTPIPHWPMRLRMGIIRQHSPCGAESSRASAAALRHR